MPIDGGGGAGPGSSATPATSVSCDFGPFGEQTRVNLKTLGAQKLCEIAFFSRFPLSSASFKPLSLTSLTDSAVVALLTAQFLPESRAHVFNAGASVWGLDWCPIHPDDRPSKNVFVYCGASLTLRRVRLLL
jgi:hypothetical protein